MCYFSITSINHARYKMPNIFVYDKNSSYVKKKNYNSNYISCIDILFTCKKIFDIVHRFAQGMAKATKY
jgi:hypothetical protein